MNEFMTEDEVRMFFGGHRSPIDADTLRRAVARGNVPLPVRVTPFVKRWLRSECEEAMNRLLAGRQ